MLGGHVDSLHLEQSLVAQVALTVWSVVVRFLSASVDQKTTRARVSQGPLLIAYEMPGAGEACSLLLTIWDVTAVCACTLPA
jgi:hypothetical protein